jgi:hypothetical protein
MAATTAHISFLGGGMVLSAATPYERQLLVEHILGQVRSKRQIQVRADRRHWMIELADEQQPAMCERCGRTILDAVCRGRRGESPQCVGCALAV